MDNSRILHYESNKWQKSNNLYFEYMDKLTDMINRKYISDEIPKEIVTNFGAYGGDANIAHMLYKYELYKRVLYLNGNIGEIGIYKGKSFLYWAKLVKLFEPYNLTQVYGFDWFEGMKPKENDDVNQQGKYIGSYEELLKLVEWQGLEDIALVFNINVITDSVKFIQTRPYLRFKILYIDCGIKEVMEAAFKAFYPRLVSGGILMMDHYNYAVSPTESDIAEKYIGKNIIHQMPFGRQPTGYIIKE
ncbi:class I SAM-dependent methyltransferase [Clostridium kluyveri]|uniref:class I SAM-dependent methyltransferase n=1 Tax=Clostridium kluyveri TaxID=1534 RepID=UPI00224799E1|nr:class I SAM-dependent methyltransferase [Clostridium kluyveri]UZQ50531.1 class I SAM-dependent methyltransferase [Clostridium kluyveri]